MTNADDALPATFQLPQEVIEFRNLTRRIVRDELLPLEQRYIVHPGQGMTLRARDALRAVFPQNIVDNDAIQIHGAMGESLELPLTMFYRHIRHARIGGGTSEIQRMLLAHMLLKD